LANRPAANITSSSGYQRAPEEPRKRYPQRSLAFSYQLDPQAQEAAASQPASLNAVERYAPSRRKLFSKGIEPRRVLDFRKMTDAFMLDVSRMWCNVQQRALVAPAMGAVVHAPDSECRLRER